MTFHLKWFWSFYFHHFYNSIGSKIKKWNKVRRSHPNIYDYCLFFSGIATPSELKFTAKCWYFITEEKVITYPSFEVTFCFFFLISKSNNSHMKSVERSERIHQLKMKNRSFDKKKYATSQISTHPLSKPLYHLLLADIVSDHMLSNLCT